jgi:cell division protein FtsX
MLVIAAYFFALLYLAGLSLSALRASPPLGWQSVALVLVYAVAFTLLTVVLLVSIALALSLHGYADP